LQTQIPENLDLRSKLKEETYSSLLEMWERMPNDARQSQPDTSTAKRLIRAIEINMFLQAHPSFEFKNRKPIEALVFGLSPAIEQRRQNIEKRLNIRLNQGLIDEVKQLLASGIAADTLIYYGL
jgi:tRNA dimethylallyltransferase